MGEVGFLPGQVRKKRILKSSALGPPGRCQKLRMALKFVFKNLKMRELR